MRYSIRPLLLIFMLLNTAVSKDITAGIRDTLSSHILQEERSVSVYLPPSYHQNNNYTFPVLYLMDGDYNFRYVAGLIEHQSAISAFIPEMIVVAISGKGTEQYRHNCKPNIAGLKDAGSADKMARFIAEELRPFIKNKYKAADYDLLAGHSIGGLFVVNTALNNPQLFNHFIAISPSLWWENNAINGVAEKIISQNAEFKTDVYLSLANEKGMGVRSYLVLATDLFWTQKSSAYGVLIVAIFIALMLFLRLKDGRRIFYPFVVILLGMVMSGYLLYLHFPTNQNFKFKQMAGQNHNSVGLPTLEWALQDVFKEWYVEKQYFESVKEFKTFREKIENAFGRQFSLSYGSVYNTVKYILNEDEHALLQIKEEVKTHFPEFLERYNTLLAMHYINKQDYIAAEDVLNMTLAQFPKSWAAFEKMAELKTEQKQWVKADSLFGISMELAKKQHIRQWQINEIEEKRKKVIEAVK